MQIGCLLIVILRRTILRCSSSFLLFYILFLQVWSWYSLSKTLAEEAAWKFVKENNIDMVAINPGIVLGPLLQPSLNDSSGAVLNLINGKFLSTCKVHGVKICVICLNLDNLIIFNWNDYFGSCYLNGELVSNVTRFMVHWFICIGNYLIDYPFSLLLFLEMLSEYLLNILFFCPLDK